MLDEHNIMEDCPKEPIIIKQKQVFKLGKTFEHHPMVVHVNLDDDNGKAFSPNSSLTENFEKITSGITEMDFYHNQMEKLANQTFTYEQVKLIGFSGSGLLLVIIMIIIFSCYLCRPSTTIADAIVASSLVSNMNRSQESIIQQPPAYSSNINISIMSPSQTHQTENLYPINKLERFVHFGWQKLNDEKSRKPTPYPSLNSIYSAETTPTAPLEIDNQIVNHKICPKLKPMVELLNQKTKMSTLSLPGTSKQKSRGDV